MSWSTCIDSLDVVSCDTDENWLPDVIENKYENAFMYLLHSCSSYEEFMLCKDLEQIQFDEQCIRHLGFNDEDELACFIRDYYTNNKGI